MLINLTSFQWLFPTTFTFFSSILFLPSPSSFPASLLLPFPLCRFSAWRCILHDLSSLLLCGGFCCYCLEMDHRPAIVCVWLLPVRLLAPAASPPALFACLSQRFPLSHCLPASTSTLFILPRMLPGVLFEMDASLLFQPHSEPLGSGS